MELYAPGLLSFDSEGGILHALGRAYNAGGSGQADYGVAVGHPHGGLLRQTFHKRVGGILDAQTGPSVLAGRGRGNLTAAADRQPLGSITYTQQGKHSPDAGQIGLGSIGIPDGSGASGEYDSESVGIDGGHFVEGVNLAVHSYLPDATRYELGVLGSEIKYKYLIHLWYSWGFLW